MANIFDKDTGNTDNHLLNEQFHAFSKSPSSPGSTLGGASNRSGHTVSASDVWAEKIPAFFYPKADSDYAVCKANAKLNDICRWGDEIQIWDGEKFVKFADNYAAIPDGHEFLNEDGQPVVRFHKSRVAYNLNDTNNAYDNSLDASGKGASAKILGWDKTANDGAGGVYAYVESAPQFITQFVAPTDNIVKGVPSKGYGPIVMVGGSPLTEDADSTAGYIANNFAGIIQFNERKSQGTVTVHAFEYCGKTLGTTASDIAELEDKLSKISVTASGGVQDASTDAKTAGFSVTTEKRTNSEGKEETIPVFDIETGSVATGVTKLVTGDAVKTYVDTTALTPETGSIAKAIADYVAENAKVSVNEVEAKKVTVASGSQTGDLVQIVVTNDKTKAEDGEIGIKLSAQIEAAQWDEATQSFTNPDAVLVAGVAQTVINNTIINQITEVIGEVPEGETPTIATAIKKGITDATLADADNAIASATGDAADKLVTAEQVKEYVDENAKVTLTADTATGKTGIVIDKNGQESTSFTIGIDQSVIATKKSVDDLSGIVSKLPATIQAAQDTADAAMEEAQKKVVSVSGPTTGLVTVTGDKEVTITVSDTIATKEYASTAASTAVNGLKETAITSQSVSGAGVSVTLGGKVGAPTLTGSVTPATYTSSTKSWTNDSNFAKASDIATAISDAVGAITIPSVTTSTAAQTVGVTASGHEVSVATADYTASTDTWTNKSYLVTGATVEAFVNDVVSEVSSDLTTLENKVNAYHKAGVSYKIHTEPTLPDLSIEDNVKEYKNVILLIPKDTGTQVLPPSAMSGDYTEFLCVNKGTEEAPQWVWEQIGTTAADLKGYVKAITVNGKEKYTDTGDVYLTLGSFAETVASGQATTLANQSSVYANIATNGTLTLGIASATDSVMGVSKMFTGYLDHTTTTGAEDTAVSVKSAQAMYTKLAALANGKVSTVSEDWYLNLAGLAVSTSGTNVAIKSTNITQFDSSIIGVNGNIATGVNGAKINIDTDKIFATNASATPITMIKGKTNLQYWIADIPNVVNGSSMFEGCTQLATFCGDLSSLTNGCNMFYLATALTSFCGDLSSLTDGTQMFYTCKLDAESLECIVDTINDVRSLTTSTEVTKKISISYNCSAADAESAKTAIEGKGWTCIMTYHA